MKTIVISLMIIAAMTALAMSYESGLKRQCAWAAENEQLSHPDFSWCP